MAAAAAIAGKLKDVRDLLPEMQAGGPGVRQKRPKGAVAVDHSLVFSCFCKTYSTTHFKHQKVSQWQDLFAVSQMMKMIDPKK